MHDVAQTKLGFYQLSGVPNVIGAVDGTQIQIMAPSKDENIYICRKGYHSINIQAIVDSKLRWCISVSLFYLHVFDYDELFIFASLSIM